MNIRKLTFSFLTAMCSVPSAEVIAQDIPVVACNTTDEVHNNFSKAARVNQALTELTSKGIPGCAIAVYSEEGWWTSAAGLAKIENKTVMQSCHLQYLQSAAKTYMAVAVLKLAEQGKIKLDDPITTYLPLRISKNISDAKKISVRMLLNHTSGIPEYNSVPAYIGYLLQHSEYLFKPEDYIRYIRGKPLSYTPGTRFDYRNTNFLVLAIIVDEITGDHAKFIRETIFAPLALTHTFYRGDAGYLDYPELVNTYWDRYSNGIVENASTLQRNNVRTLVGDDGIVTTPMEAVKFLRGLLEIKLLSPASVEQMKTWVNDAKGRPTYGLGLDHATFAGHTGYGHSGGGLGAGCQLFFFPDKNVYVFVAINLGTVTDSPLHHAVTETVEKVYRILLD